MRVIMELDLDNASFEDDIEGELAVVMEAVAEKIVALYQGEGPNEDIFDSNGNVVGEVRMEFDDDDDDDDEDDDGEDET